MATNDTVEKNDTIKIEEAPETGDITKINEEVDENVEAEAADTMESADTEDNVDTDEASAAAEKEAGEADAVDSDTDDEASVADMEEMKRQKRRKRRIRNKVLSIMAVIFMILLIAALGVLVYLKLDEIHKESEHQNDVVEKLEELTQNETEIPVISEPDVDVEVPEVDPLEEALKEQIAQMNVEDKVAALFFVTPEDITGVGTAIKAGDGTKEALEEYPVGGLIYFKKNIQSEDQVKEMLATTKEYSPYIFLGVNEEGGSVSSVASKLDVEDVESAGTLGENATTDATYETGKTIGTYLSELGFNVNFAPVADVITDEDNALLGDRSFGSDASGVASHVSAMVKGMEETGISACVKGFPGIGSANKDPEDGLAITERTLEEMQNAEFLGFQAAIIENADFIMVSNVTAPQLAGGEYTPSCLSKDIVKGILREQLGYEGIIITSPLNEVAITDYYTSSEATIMAIEAGADMILMPDDFEEAYFGLLAEVLEGNISEERIDESLLRIYKVKYADMLVE